MKSAYKRPLLFCCTTLFLLTLTSCTISSQYIKTDAQGQVTRLQRDLHVEGVHYKVDAELTAALTLDNTGNEILALPEQSYIHINSTSYKLSFVSEDSKTKSGLSLNGQAVSDSSQSRQQIKQLTLILFRNTPVDAKGRVKTLLAYQGADKVLDEIRLITDQETKKLYITELAKQAVLTEQQQLQLIHNSSTIQSDYDLTELLLSLLMTAPQQQDVQKAILQASLRINSDYDKRRLMSRLAQAQSSFDLSLILQVSQDIESDYELGQLLQQIAPQVRNDEVLGAVLNAAKTMESSYELQQVLSVLPFEFFTQVQNERVIATAASIIESDYELANTLIALLRRSKEPQALQSAVTAALNTISNDSDKVRVFELYYSAR